MMPHKCLLQVYYSEMAPALCVKIHTQVEICQQEVDTLEDKLILHVLHLFQ